MEVLNPDQLKGVIAHEMSHIKHSDTLISTLAATIAGAIGFLASMSRWAMIFGGGGRDDDDNNILGVLIVAIVAPIAAMIIQMAISRQREYVADRGAATLCGNPVFLIEALRNLDMNNQRQPIKGGNPATAHLFIVNPFKLKGMTKLFSTHPPIEERISRLEGYGV
jgi:heat shock protein HtpX